MQIIFEKLYTGTYEVMFLLQIYSCELEEAENFNDFADFCHSFQFGRGKDEDDEESNIVGELKVKKY